MSPSEQMVAQAEGVAAKLTFSEALDMYLDARDSGPNDRDGYTDKWFYYTQAALRRRMDALIGARS